ncbi:uncharacterized protein LOC128228426 [Mya arenaria]|uniref:uncharacterized protein LOC128228426 n=1 Tax=Mya arenaria TaxID=6604 RepID=UPI0022E60A6C|nr:uncharacterized protein LOC128228426 [Mya arenaria]
MVNEIPISAVEKLEQAISKHLRRWLGLPPSFTNIGLYGKSTKLQMPISSLVEEYKIAKTRLLLTLRDSSDGKISGAGIEVRTGRKWSVSLTVEQAKSSLKHQDIVGTTNKGREDSPQLISFVRQGEKKPTKTMCIGILQESENWDMLVDLGEKLKFPEEVAHTTLWPNIVLWSRSPKLVVLVELTEPWEERCEEAYELKKGKYQDLVDTCKERGWKTWL